MADGLFSPSYFQVHDVKELGVHPASEDRIPSDSAHRKSILRNEPLCFIINSIETIMIRYVFTDGCDLDVSISLSSS